MGLTLVTGASGFVGTHLVQEMRQRGLPVRGVSRQKRPGLVTIPSYGPEVNWTAYLADVDVVVHLAARVHVMRETARDPLAEFRAANVGATLNLARQAARAGIRRFIYVSTIKVNGENTEPGKPFTADDPPNPQNPYAISKAEAEDALIDLGQKSPMEIVIVRPPLVYGPGVGGNFRNLVKWASYGIPSIFAGIRNRRSLIFVGNLCDLIIKAITHPQLNGILLVSDGPAVSTHELILGLATALGRRSPSVIIPPTILYLGGVLLRRKHALIRLLHNLEIDDQATRQRLSWHAPYDTREALRITVCAPVADAHQLGTPTDKKRTRPPF
ncbi:NAD-dependent epimerase/dehydratase family protein [Pseudorhizobium flavum]|uniref:NAD-dependent epimerase/dehydratase family protein n=1 Tax=Pseudorhizobium flavum TaxID=1335061 RepID=UPI00376F891B